MFLKSLTLKGFKSFADATTLAMEPGVTVVVGPNGSGKSNVVDAIGWVLGAQAPSTVRSAKMDDVIFAGTSKRSALGRAEVSLAIDNSSGLLPLDFTEVTITRTLFRTGESEYAINGVPCRLLDVQELLSDTGMGRQQHVIISQGQIDAVLNARPEERRLIIEEAAGVLKYRRRKEKAERRLANTEANLTRLEDLLREVRRQLRPLEKQADAARRHQGLVDELHALRIHLSGRDLTRLRKRMGDTERHDGESQRAERDLKSALAEVDAELVAAESELVAMGGRDLSEQLGRCESLRERARGQRALIAERRRRIESEWASEMDRGVVASLEAEAAEVAAQLATLEEETDELVPAEREVTDSEAQIATDRERFEVEFPDDGPTVSRAAEVRGELSASSESCSRAEAEQNRLVDRSSIVDERVARLATELAELHRVLEAAMAAEPQRRAEVDQATDANEISVRNAREAEKLAQDAEAERAATAARVETLESALDAARARAGARHLAGIDGVVGTLLDVVEVDDGYQAAFEAGAGEAIAAVVVDGAVDARNALGKLRNGGVSGAVLSMGGDRDDRAVELPAHAGTSPLRAHVKGTQPGIERLLDVLVGTVAVADTWQSALEVVSSDPDALVVTRDGDRFAPTGWRVVTDGTGTTGAALDKARNEAQQMSDRAAERRQRAEEAAREREAAQAVLDDARERLRQVVDDADTARTRLERVAADRDEAGIEAEAIQEQLAQLRSQLENDLRRVDELTDALARLEEEEALAARVNERRETMRQELEIRQAAVAQRRSEVELRSAGLTERRQLLIRRSEEIEARLERDDAQRARAGARRADQDRIGVALTALDALVARRLQELDDMIGGLRRQRHRQSEQERTQARRLEEVRSRRGTLEDGLESRRNERQQLGLTMAELRVRVEQIVEVLRGELDVDPESAMAAECPDLDDGVTPVGRVRDLEIELRRMGSINPLALAEYDAMQERHEFLSGQLDDVRSSRRELTKVIREVDAEIAATFVAAYADVQANFSELFTTLFPGGTGELRLTDPEQPLTTGIEISAKPSGKNVRNLSLLSGGERSLVALAYLFAVFRSRSSPFYVMDEVEAALDDVNLHRFLDLIAEFRHTAQLIIVSHQKRTMEAADALFGVTMQSGGSSKVVSERV